MFIIPIRSDRRLAHAVWVNHLLIFANIAFFIAQIVGQSRQVNPWFNSLILTPVQPHWYQFFTYQFLHQSWDHVILNMLFLYVFGDSLEDRLGPIGYMCFYLAGGVVAGVGHCAVGSTAPVLGASGAVSAVTGAYLVLFPFSYLTFTLFFLRQFEVASYVVVLFSFARDLFYQLAGQSGVAYMAHVSGNVFGFVIAMGLLVTRLVPREPYDLLTFVGRWRRRRQRRVLHDGSDAPAVSAGAELRNMTVQMKEQVAHVRSAVEQALRERDAVASVEAYEELLDLDPQQVLTRQEQLDVANDAMERGRYATAARAYELFLATFAGDPFADQVQLILGLIYAKYLDNPRRARPLLTAAAESLTDPRRRQQAREMLEQLE